MDSKPVKYLVKYWSLLEVSNISKTTENFVALSDTQYIRSNIYPFLSQLLKFYVSNDLDAYNKLSNDLKINIQSTYNDLNNPFSRENFPYKLKNAVPYAMEEDDGGYASSNNTNNTNTVEEGLSVGSATSSSPMDLLEAKRMFGDLVKDTYEELNSDSDPNPLPPAIIESSPLPIKEEFKDWKTPNFYSNNELLINGKIDVLIERVYDPNHYLDTLTNEEYKKRWNKERSIYTDFKKGKVESYHGGKVIKISFYTLSNNCQFPSWEKNNKQSEKLKVIVDRLIKLDYIHECKLQEKKLKVYKSIETLKKNLKLLKKWREANEESDDYEYEESVLPPFF